MASSAPPPPSAPPRKKAAALPQRPIGRVDFIGSFPKLPPKLGLPEVAFAGRSNVGKSSAINALLGRKKAARVSNTPGRTRLLNVFRVEDRLTFVDLPGYGFARVSSELQDEWRDMIEGYLQRRDELRLVISLIDASIPPQESDAHLLAGMRELGLPVLVLATKADRLSKAARKPACWKLADAHGLPRGDVLPFSSAKGEGIDAAWARIDAALRTTKEPRHA